MRPPIPNQTAGGQVGKGCGKALCPGAQSTGCKGPGTRTPHAPCGSQALGQPLVPLCGERLAQCAHQHQLPLGILSTTQWGCSWGDKGRLQVEPRAPLSVWQG